MKIASSLFQSIYSLCLCVPYYSLDRETLELCPDGNVVRKIEDSESTTAKLMEIKHKINLVLKST